MKIVKLIPGQQPEVIDVPRDVVSAARGIIGNSLDFTKVVYEGKRCTMAVDDEGMSKNLPVNELATKAYHAHCVPGTVWPICGPAVVFDGYLP